MEVRKLTVRSQEWGETEIEVWVECYSPDDVDMMIAWLTFAKQMMEHWAKICSKHLPWPPDNE